MKLSQFLLGSIGLQEVAGAGNCTEGFELAENGKCKFTAYPTGYQWYPMVDKDHVWWISGADPEAGYATSHLEVWGSLGSLGLNLLLCEEYFKIPYGVLVPGGKYVCDDNMQALTSARYSNQGRNCCHWKDFVVHCEDCAPAQYNFIGRTNSGDNGTPIFWDNDNSPSGTYGFTSNDGNVYDSALVEMPGVSIDAAAAICKAVGARLFQEEVFMWVPEDFFTAPNKGGCNAVIEMYSKAHGRLYQPRKWDDTYAGRIMTGYRANAALDNWCYFDGTTCHDTQTNTAIGVHIDSNNDWVKADSSEPDCNNAQFAAAINTALQREIANLPMTPSSADDCIFMDMALEEMVVGSCSSPTTDGFMCERETWDCSLNGGSGRCSHGCDTAGFCTCPDGMFLIDFTTCAEKPSLEEIECYPTHMIAHFPVADLNYVSELTLNDPNCTDHVSIQNDMYRVEVRYDECGTQADYANNHTEIIFSNALSSRKDFTGKINIESRVTNTFECHFNAIMTVDDVNGAGSGGPGCDNGLVDCNDNGQPGTIDVKSEKAELEREELGMFSFDILTYSDASFAQQLPAGTQNRVGEPLHFAVVPENILSNLVYQTTACSILAADNSTSYVLFEDEKPDTWVNPMRYRPYYSDTNGGESCAVETQDKFSYTVFEFVDQTAEGAAGQQQHIKCSVMVCIKEDDMTDSPCNQQTCQFWDDAGQSGNAL